MYVFLRECIKKKSFVFHFLHKRSKTHYCDGESLYILVITLLIILKVKVGGV